MPSGSPSGCVAKLKLPWEGVDVRSVPAFRLAFPELASEFKRRMAG